MKIAVPTEDKLAVSGDPRKSHCFKIISMKGGEIVNEEFRANPLNNDLQNSPLSSLESDKVLTLLADCDALLCKQCQRGFFNSRIPDSLVTIKTSQSLITTAALEYVNGFLYNERNTCCSP